MNARGALFAALVALLLSAVACEEKNTRVEKVTARPRPADGAPAAEAEAAPADAGRLASALPTESDSSVLLAIAQPVPPAPRGLPETPNPGYNRTTPAKVALGELLFFDRRLSPERTLACTGCHIPELGFADGKQRSRTAAGKLNLRHTPTLLNVAYRERYAWDGAYASLEAQILANWRGQMRAHPEAVAARLAVIPRYQAHFRRAFGGAPTPKRIAEALAAFLRTLRSGDSPWDRYEDGDNTAVGDDAVAGFKIFSERAGCALCHMPPLYTDLRFHDRGVGGDHRPRDPGRYRITGKRSDLGAFQTPTLRSVATTAPYFHDGSAATLAQAVSEELARSAASGALEVPLSAVEKTQLLAFLVALTPSARARPRPSIPPDPPPEPNDGGLVSADAQAP